VLILVLITILAFEASGSNCSNYNPKRDNMQKLREFSKVVNKEAIKQHESVKLGLK
jgi:hypothetical protein